MKSCLRNAPCRWTLLNKIKYRSSHPHDEWHYWSTGSETVESTFMMIHHGYERDQIPFHEASWRFMVIGILNGLQARVLILLKRRGYIKMQLLTNPFWVFGCNKWFDSLILNPFKILINAGIQYMKGFFEEFLTCSKTFCRGILSVAFLWTLFRFRILRLFLKCTYTHVFW